MLGIRWQIFYELSDDFYDIFVFIEILAAWIKLAHWEAISDYFYGVNSLIINVVYVGGR